jgi:hypothetical protein
MLTVLFAIITGLLTGFTAVAAAKLFKIDSGSKALPTASSTSGHGKAA